MNRTEVYEEWLPGECQLGCLTNWYKMEMFHNVNTAQCVRSHTHLIYLFWPRVTCLLQEGKTWRAILDEPLACILEIIYFR